jgi:hypothetical protein
MIGLRQPIGEIDTELPSAKSAFVAWCFGFFT